MDEGIFWTVGFTDGFHRLPQGLAASCPRALRAGTHFSIIPPANPCRINSLDDGILSRRIYYPAIMSSMN